MTKLSLSIWTKHLLILAFTVNSLFPLQLFSSESQQCRSIFSEQIKSDKTWEAQKEQSPFSESLIATIVSSVVWLSLVQLIRYFGGPADQSFFDQAFLLTVPIDVSLTLLSHAISLGNISVINKFIEGKIFPKKYEYWGRVMANVSISSAVILTGWSVSGIDLRFEHILAAVGLCMAVYPSLQVTKNYLFVEQTKKKKDTLSAQFFAKYPQLIELSKKFNPKQTSVESSSLNTLILDSLEQLILNHPWETKLAKLQDFVEAPKLQKILSEINSLKFKVESSASGKTEAHILQIKKLRSLLIEESLQLRGKSLELDQILASQLAFKGEISSYDSLDILKDIFDIQKQRRQQIITNSLIDQSIAVGIAGGVFLYYTNHWAATGQIGF